MPFLRPIDNIELATRALHSRRGETGNVAARIGFRDGDATPLLPGQEVREDPVLQLRVRELQDGRDAEREARRQAAGRAEAARAGHLVGEDEGVHVVEVLDLDAAGQRADAKTPQPRHRQRGRQRRHQHVRRGEVAEHVLGNRLRLFPFHGVL